MLHGPAGGVDTPSDAPIWRKLSNFDTLRLSDVQHAAPHHSGVAGLHRTVSFTAFGRYVQLLKGLCSGSPIVSRVG